MDTATPSQPSPPASAQPEWPPFTKCRECGCTNEDCRQCIEATGEPCSWAGPYLCTRCIVN